MKCIEYKRYQDYDPEDVVIVMQTMKDLELSRDRNQEQLDEIFKVLTMAEIENQPPRVVYSPCGFGKTEILKIIAQSFLKKYGDKKIVLALPNNFLLTRMSESYKEVGVNITQKCKVYDTTKKINDEYIKSEC